MNVEKSGPPDRGRDDLFGIELAHSGRARVGLNDLTKHRVVWMFRTGRLPTAAEENLQAVRTLGCDIEQSGEWCSKELPEASGAYWILLLTLGMRPPTRTRAYWDGGTWGVTPETVAVWDAGSYVITGWLKPGVESGQPAGRPTAPSPSESVRRIKELEEQLAATTLSEVSFRRLLALRASEPHRLYADGGELSDSSTEPAIDFRRDSAREIERKLTIRSMHRAEPALSALGPMQLSARIREIAEDCAHEMTEVRLEELSEALDSIGGLHGLLDIACCHFTEGRYGWPDPRTHEAIISRWLKFGQPVPDVFHPEDGSAEYPGSRASLRDQLALAGMVFRKYEVLHRAKGAEDGTAKADANAALASGIEKALRDYAAKV